MKNKLIQLTKRIFSIIVIIAVVLSVFANYTVMQSNAASLSKKKELVDIKVPIKATEFAEEHLNPLVSVHMQYSEDINIKNTAEVILGNPFVIFNSSDTTWEEVYYYPVIENEKVILVISVINTNVGYTVSISEEYVDYLNKINYVKDNSFIFFIDGGELIARSTNTYFVLGTLSSLKKQASQKSIFGTEDYDYQVEYISKKMDCMEKVDLNKRISMSYAEDIYEGYSPSFETSTDTCKICKLKNPQGQGSYAICWAASVATIINYRKGTSYTATDVCDKINVNYEANNIDAKKRALSAYGINYLKYSSQLTWANLIANIDDKYPVAASTFKSSGIGHSITVHGYRSIGTSDYIVFWDSQTQSTKTVYYISTGSTYTMSGNTYTWTKSLSFY